MGVQARIVLYAPDSSTAEYAARAAFDRIAELDAVMSDYRDDSELMRLAARAGTGAVSVSEDLFRVLELAQRIAMQSDGAFDVTVGPYVRLWREARRVRRLPAGDALAQASRVVGWRKIVLDPKARTVALLTRGMQLDLGAIAKGYAADAALEVLRAHDVGRALIEFGGDIVVGDAPPGTEGWKIKAVLADPDQQEIVMTNAAVSTSGDTEQFVIIGGTRYSHVVDPRSGVGLTTRIAATVIAPTGILADALSTSISAMGESAARELINREYPEVSVFVRHLKESGSLGF